jgi:uncharacterized membrane protein YbaN (DUF454 family)
MSLLRTVGGFVLVVVGIVGLILPIMPGWIFLIPGLGLLAERFDWAKRLVAWAKQKAKTAAVR